MIPRGTTFEFEYLGEFEMEIKKFFGHESGAHMGLIHEKNKRPTISCYSTFKLGLKRIFLLPPPPPPPKGRGGGGGVWGGAVF